MRTLPPTLFLPEGKIQRMDLFPTYVYDVECYDLVDDVLEVLDKIEWRQNRSESVFALKDYPEVTKIFEDRLSYTVSELEYQVSSFKMTTSWFTRNSPGQGIPSHYHTNSFLSSVFYMDDNCGRLSFSKEESGITVVSRTGNHVVHIPCKKGHMLVFPSSVKHHVQGVPSKDNRERYSLAMNFMPEGECGMNDSLYCY